jgi:uncharacterized membrane protein YbhN (UPF0104 family)
VIPPPPAEATTNASLVEATTSAAVAETTATLRRRPLLLAIVVDTAAWRFGLVAVGMGLAVVALHGRFPAWPDVWAVLTEARPAWLMLAVLLQVVSMGAASGQQRHVLAALCVPMTRRASLSVTYARAAMSIGLPAGSALSTAYAFRQFRARGADNRIAAAVLVLCGAASLASLAALYLLDLAAWTLPRPGRYPLLVLALAVAVAVALAARRAGRRRGTATTCAVPPARGTRLGRLLAVVGETLRLTATIPATRWSVIGGFAALNWIADAASLLAGVRAVGLAVPAGDVLTAYLAVQLIRQIPVTPGGIGVAEASLFVALTAAGADDTPAAAGVLIYRVLSYWAVLPVGLACWAAQQTRAGVGADRCE